MALLPSIAGLDLSDAVIRVAVVSSSPRQSKVTHFQELLIAPGIIVDGEVVQPDVLAERVKMLLHHARPSSVSNRPVVVGLPDRRTFIKLLAISTAAGANLQSQVETELVQHIPFSLDEVYYDWQVIHQEGAAASVLVSAAPKSLVDQYMTALHKADVSVVGLETESQALTRAVFPDTPPNESQMIVDLGGTRTTIAVVGAGTIQFASSLPFSGTQLTHGLVKELRLSADDAEKAKQLYGLSRTKGRGSVGKVLTGQLKELIEKIHELESFYTNHFSPADSVQKIVLTGGGALLQGLPEYLSDTLSKTVERGNPCQSLENAAGIPPHRVASFTTAIGLARRPW